MVPGLPTQKRFKVEKGDTDAVPIGEGEIVRLWYREHTEGKWPFPKSRIDKPQDAPTYFQPRNHDDMVHWECEYVDVSRCYSQLMAKLPSLVVKFDYGLRKLGAVESLPRYDGLMQGKWFGRAASGMMRSKQGRYFKYGEPKRFPSRYYHGETINWLHAVLHCLASQAVDEYGCFRWHTDGGFFPIRQGQAFAQLLDLWGIEYKLTRYIGVIFASFNDYMAVTPEGRTDKTKGYDSTMVSDYVFLPLNQGGSSTNNLIHNLDADFLRGTVNVP
jgi:hypothetical protein